MKRSLLCLTLTSVLCLAFSAYPAPHAGNYQRGNYQQPSVRRPSAPVHPARPAHPSAPNHPGVPSAPVHPGAPVHPRQPSAPAYRAVPANYGPARHYGAPPAPAHYSGPAPSSYSAPRHNYGSSAAQGPSHYGAPSAYQPVRPVRATSHGTSNNYPQKHSSSSYKSESQSQSHGREMKYTIRDPHNRGTTHVTETHVVSNREMHGAEAEAAMKKLMGSMGPSSYGSDGGFQDFVKNMGLPYF